MCVFAAVLFAVCMTGSALGQEAPKELDTWDFSITPYMWALSLDGDITVEGNKSSVDIDFDTIFDDLNLAMMVEMEGRKDRFGFFVSPIYAQLEDDTHLLDVEIDIWIVEFGGFYRLGTWPLDSQSKTSNPSLTVDVYAGGRYTYVKLDLDGKGILDGVIDDSGHQDWVDPIVGLRTLWDLSPKWTASLTGDVGGFGVASDFTWQARALLGYKINDHARIFGGYRWMGWDYEDGSGADKFEWDVTLEGPIFGLSWDF
jgi:hypothetical protein